MAANEPTIQFSTEWSIEDGDCSECYECKDMIVGKKHVLDIKINGMGEEKIGICNSCYEMITA